MSTTRGEGMKLPGWLPRFGGTETRASLENPSTPLSAPDAWLFDALGSSQAAGATVTPANSLEVTTVWAAVSQIARTTATLPLHVYQRTADGKAKAPEHPAYYLLHTRPNPEHSSFIFRELLATWLLLWGDFFAEIEWDNAGRALALWPIHPTNVQVARVNGAKLYAVNVNGQTVTLPASSVLHIQGFGIDGLRGLVPTLVGRNAIGLAKATEAFGAGFFANGAQPGGLLTLPGRLTQAQADDIRAKWTAAQGGLTNAQRIAVLDADAKWSSLAVAPENAQFLETRRFSVEEVARLFGIPLHMVGHLDRMTFNNVEQMAIQFVTATIEPLAKRIEYELTYRVIGPDDPAHFAEFDLNGLLRGDTQTRKEYYVAAIQNGWMSVNEVRALENLNRIEGGDEHYRPLNLGPIGQTQEGQ